MIPIKIDSAWRGTSDCRSCGIRDMVLSAQVMALAEDVPALDYFYRYYNAEWPLVGLNLAVLRDPRDPHAGI